jgi:glyoxylase-like metal-dependent hydrolase (beta-lactamase superfamily II)
MTRVLLCVALAACSHQPRQKTDDDKTPPPAPPGQDVALKVTPMGGNVHMIEGRGGNIGVSAGPDGKLVIDDQFEELAPKIQAAVDALGGGGIEFLVNTHWHGDHTGGNPIFGQDATIIAHVNVRARLATEQNARGRVVPPMAKPGLPVITFADGVTLHFNGEEIRVLHLPAGHTDGDSAIWFVGSNVVHMGDHFFAGRFPYVDTGSGGSVAGYTANVARVLELVPADAKVIPGHGPPSTVPDLEAFHAMLVETTASVREQKRLGKKPDQMTLDAKWDAWGAGFIKTRDWIETIYRSL